MVHILTSTQKEILKKYFLFFNLLDEAEQNKFELRLAEFLHIKTFKTVRGLPPSEEIKVLVSAIAIKMTFGLKNYLFYHFHTIIIHPTSYFSNVTQNFHSGEVRTDGFFVINWKSVIDALQNPNQVYSLPVHFWSQALLFEEVIFRQTIFEQEPTDILKWQKMAVGKIDQSRINFPSKNPIYLQSNLEALLTACSESFFETPYFLSKKSPDIYRFMGLMYNQDMLGLLSKAS